VSDVPLSDDLRLFLARYVHSIAELELLLLLSASPDRWWSAAEVYKVVLSNEELVGRTLETFSQLGLAGKSETGTYQFSPASEQIRTLVRTLAGLYHERPTRIIQAIYERPVSEIGEFAKAFRIRKDS
jgi:hypothetical protein